jgi:hypothetical protein
MQCLEHPALCSLRELLVSLPASQIPRLDSTRKSTPLLDPTRTTEGTVSTPILVSGVERRAHVRTDRNAAEGRPDGLYGNNFGWTTSDVIRRATVVFDTRLDGSGKEYYSNILAMAAPRGSGRYGHDVIRGILATAYTGFMAARLESLVHAGFLVRHHDNGEMGHTSLADPIPNTEIPRVKVHTGNWGCGAFGGNPVIMAILQTAAAQMAGVQLVYHVQGAANKEEYGRAMKDHEGLLGTLAVEGYVPLRDFIDAVCKKNYVWGVSNGT